MTASLITKANGAISLYNLLLFKFAKRVCWIKCLLRFGIPFYIPGCSVLSSKCQHLHKTVCEGSSCYYLYEVGVNFLTWDHSRDVCIKYGLEVSRIESNQTQNVIERLLQDLPQSTPRQIWIGGRRSTDDKWIYMNGAEFNKYCLYLYIKFRRFSLIF
ncbi:hypothetical protein LSH36_688g01096 [Paralvinella palmiformis]|uniref:C-type lectin domain-containing protein n=1 Tax=Paralvinella palmiformis TaxID=53620 RepID=A0AAD9MVG3_9ANNE|nr:hypothetical protein LSH36_688g01096 [Paralvinella palmiformis]